MSFKYKVIKKAISVELANFLFNYLKVKNDAVNYLYTNNLHEQSPILGSWSVDDQIPNTYACYGDFAMETLLLKLTPIMKINTGLNLIPTYSYARIYKKGDELKRHKDRPSCEISTTLNLGGDRWDIFLEPSGKTNQNGTKIDLKQGDMLVYSGCELEHWREPFQGKVCGQVFLHYNNLDGKFKNENKYDGRPMLGLPSYTKK